MEFRCYKLSFAIIFLAIVSMGGVLYKTYLSNRTLEVTNKKLTENLLLQVINFPKQNIDKGLKFEGVDGAAALNDLISDNTLIYRLTPGASVSQYEAELKNLHKISNVLAGKIVIITSFKNKTDLNSFNKRYNTVFQIYNYSGKLMEDERSPYYFVINSFFESKLLFIPDRAINRLTNLYFDRVINLFREDALKRNTSNIDSDRKNSIVKFQSEAKDLGVLDSAKKVTVEFPFSNVGNEPLVITKVETSCGCTALKWDKNEILPSGQSKIMVTYKQETGGAFRKDIFVYMNTKNSPVMLTMQGR